MWDPPNTLPPTLTEVEDGSLQILASFHLGGLWEKGYIRISECLRGFYEIPFRDLTTLWL